jgi:lipoprotein-anchoring transpeptidase ErfK/SrfK
MTRIRLLAAALGGATLLLGPIAPVHADNLGGGLIEFLATGGHMAPHAAPRYRSASRAVLTNSPNSGSMQASLGYPRWTGEIPAEYRREEVVYTKDKKVGSIVVDTEHHFLYFIVAPGHAIRYGIGVGRPGFQWSGQKVVSRKEEWPSWTPPEQMRERQPGLPIRMAGGPDNPLGARALYLGSSLYRIHGTNQPWTIGKNVSSGCIRMMNKDVIDLYNRVKVGAPVDVL